MEMVKSFEGSGWTVASFQFDGLHIEHRASDTRDATTGRWSALEAAMRDAERAVEASLGYVVKLTEKALFEHEIGDGERALADSIDAMAGADD